MRLGPGRAQCFQGLAAGRGRKGVPYAGGQRRLNESNIDIVDVI